MDVSPATVVALPGECCVGDIKNTSNILNLSILAPAGPSASLEPLSDKMDVDPPPAEGDVMMKGLDEAFKERKST